MGYKYVVLGGGMGKAVAFDLLSRKDTELVTIVDQSKEVLRLSRSLGRNSDAKCDYLVSDIGKLNAGELFRYYDVVVSALPADKNLELSGISVRSKTNFCDMGGVIDVTKMQIKKFGEEARRNGTVVVPDCGLMPGMGIIMARKLSLELDETESITIYVGGLPQKPRPPLYYQRVFNINGLASICYEKSPVLLNGKIKYLPPFSGRENIFVSELGGEVEAFATAGASIAPWTFRRMGVRNFCEKTVRWPGFIDFVKDIPREKFAETVLPHISIPVNAENPDLAWMEVEAVGKKDGKRDVISYRLLDKFDARTGLTAMEKTTGFATARMARMIAGGHARAGVNTPETAFTGDNLERLWRELGKVFEINKFRLGKA